MTAEKHGLSMGTRLAVQAQEWSQPPVCNKQTKRTIAPDSAQTEENRGESASQTVHRRRNTIEKAARLTTRWGLGATRAAGKGQRGPRGGEGSDRLHFQSNKGMHPRQRMAYLSSSPKYANRGGGPRGEGERGDNASPALRTPQKHYRKGGGGEKEKEEP